MHYSLISIFPEMFDSFLGSSLIAKGQAQRLLGFDLINPRAYCLDKHQQVDDEIYGGGPGLLIKAQPVIDALKSLQEQISTMSTLVILLTPSPRELDQELAHTMVDQYDHIVLIAGRYEGIDHRVVDRCEQQYGDHFLQLSVGKYVTLGGEVPAMAVIESTARLVPGVIHDQQSRLDESYRPEKGGSNIESPHYTRPVVVEGFEVPEVLLSGDHQKIAERRRSCGSETNT